MGTNIISGCGRALVVRTGDDAYIASVMKEIAKRRPQNAFQLGVKHLSWALICTIVTLCPVVWFVSWRKLNKALDAFLFAVAVAVGIIPQLLPAIVNSNLARGAFVLAKKNAIVKCLPSIQNIGAMTVLCSDKTGTLTEDRITMQDYLDCDSTVNQRVFDLAYMNATAQSGSLNSIDKAVVTHPRSSEFVNTAGRIGEIAFTFETRRSSAILKLESGKHLLVCKGAYEEVIALCTHLRIRDETLPLDEAHAMALSKTVSAFNSDGFRVVLVATKVLQDVSNVQETDFSGYDIDMTVEGFLTFLDPPKEDAKSSIASFRSLGIDVRVLTGDNIGVAMKVCRDLNIVHECSEDHIQAISGPELAKLDAAEFHDIVKQCKIFAKLTPEQKGQVITSLKDVHGEVVGMLGDGINDTVALRFADVGISVSTGADAAKDCADIILTQKNLSSIIDAVLGGRTTQGNTIKYIKVIFASNFGNILSVLIACSWLPFQSMTSLQLLIGGLLYEISQLAIPFDRMDDEYLAIPTIWSVWDVARFAAIQGPLSSLVDIFTFCLNWFYYNLRDANDEIGVRTFQTHWYLQGLFTQVLVVHLMRTTKIPVLQSRCRWPLVVNGAAVLTVGFALPYIKPIADAVQFTPPKTSFLGFLVVEMAFYTVVVEVTKRLQLKWFKRWI